MRKNRWRLFSSYSLHDPHCRLLRALPFAGETQSCQTHCTGTDGDSHVHKARFLGRVWRLMETSWRIMAVMHFRMCSRNRNEQSRSQPDSLRTYYSHFRCNIPFTCISLILLARGTAGIRYCSRLGSKQLEYWPSIYASTPSSQGHRGRRLRARGSGKPSGVSRITPRVSGPCRTAVDLPVS